jgi:exosortase
LEAVLWAWSIAVCVPFWIQDDNYAYGWVVPFLMFFFLWRRLGAQSREFWNDCGAAGVNARSWNPWLLSLLGLALFPTEVMRAEYHQSGSVLWGINIAKVVFSMGAAWWLGGRSLWVLTMFPLFFFLTGVPWPAAISTPLTQSLMRNVATAVREILLWCNVPVEQSGGVLHTSNGPVGIVEACSGIRSLQSGLMVSLAVGELLWLTRSRRALLVGIGIAFALINNLTRTITLAWIVEFHGPKEMHHWHDFVGNAAMWSYYAIIFFSGKLLQKGEEDPWPRRDVGSWADRVTALAWPNVPNFRPLFATTLACFVGVHLWYFLLALEAKPQTEPLFTPRLGANSGNSVEAFDETAWRQLGANVGESIRRQTSDAPLGGVSAYHLFWKPGPMSRFALHHRPDVCMPGQGWNMVGDPEPVKAKISGQELDLLAFRFEREKEKAVQVWGVWRNGRPVPFDFHKSLSSHPEVFRPWPSNRHLLGVELLSCFVPYRAGQSVDLAVATRALAAIFDRKVEKLPE